MRRDDAEAPGDVAARRARAIELFAQQLERADPTEDSLRELIAQHPEIARELADLAAGLALFRAQRPALRAQLRARRIRRMLVSAAAAAVVIAGTVWLVKHRGGAPRE